MIFIIITREKAQRSRRIDGAVDKSTREVGTAAVEPVIEPSDNTAPIPSLATAAISVLVAIPIAVKSVLVSAASAAGVTNSGGLTADGIEAQAV